MTRRCCGKARRTSGRPTPRRCCGAPPVRRARSAYRRLWRTGGSGQNCAYHGFRRQSAIAVAGGILVCLTLTACLGFNPEPQTEPIETKLPAAATQTPQESETAPCGPGTRAGAGDLRIRLCHGTRRSWTPIWTPSIGSIMATMTMPMKRGWYFTISMAS